MIWLANGDKVLRQWVRGAVVLTNAESEVLRISREDGVEARNVIPKKTGSLLRAVIPDDLLTESGYLRVQSVIRDQDGEHINEMARFIIRPAQKPEDYVHGAVDTQSWTELKLRMNALERAAREGKFNGLPGENYVLTEADKQEIADMIEVEGGGSSVPGEPGKDGVTFTPYVSADGVISWTNDGGLVNPDPVNIKGGKGDKGDPGDDYVLTEDDKQEIADMIEDGVTFTPSVSADGVISWTNDGGLVNPDPVNIKGGKGDKGDPGDDYVLTDADKQEIADMIELESGGTGDPGADGVTFTPSVSADGVISWTNDGGRENPDPVNIKGAKGDKGDKGDPGDDYVLTEADKQEIADMVTVTGEVTPMEPPTFVSSVDEMTDTGKHYVLDGYIYAWMAVQVPGQPLYTNLATSVKSGYRWSSSGEFVEKAGACVCEDIIPFSGGTVVRVRGLGKLDENNVIGSSKSDFSLVECTFKPAVAAAATYQTYSYDASTGTATMVSTGNQYAQYIRIAGVLSGDASDVIITVNEEIKIGDPTTVYQWTNTGHTYAPADYEDRIIALETESAEHDARLTVLENTQSGGGTTVTIPSFWQEAVDECVAKIKALQDGKNCVTFPFFSDNHTRDGKTQYMGILIAHVMEQCGIPYCFFGGDAITSAIASTADSDAEFREQAAAFKAAMSYIPDGRFCMALGNHEGYLKQNTSIEGSTTVNYDRDQTYDIFLRDESVYQNKHYGADGTYYYVDDLASKVRFIVLNTNGIGNTAIDADQLAWLVDTALTFTESGWAAVIFSHIPITNHYEQSNISNAADVIAAVNASGVDIIGWYSGHIHRDRIYTGISVNDTDDTEGDPLGFTQVTITSDHTAIAYPVGNSPTTHPIDDSDQSHAIDFVTINRDTMTVNLTRLGIGEDRSYTYSAAENPYEPTGGYALTEEDKTEIAQAAAGLIDTELLAIIGDGEVTV